MALTESVSPPPPHSSAIPAPSGPHYAAPPLPPVADQMDLMSVVGRALIVWFCSAMAAAAVGAVAAVVTFMMFSADGDAGYMEGLGSVLVAVLAFVVSGTLVYAVGVIVGVNRFLPSGRRLVPALVLIFPGPICTLFPLLYGAG